MDAHYVVPIFVEASANEITIQAVERSRWLSMHSPGTSNRVPGHATMPVRTMATARELGPAGWTSYLGPATTAPPGITAGGEDSKRRLERVRRAAVRLKELGARRVVLFGSLAHEGRSTLASDVDLAVLDLPADRFWDGWRLAEEIVGDRPVDLVVLEQASEPLRRAIERDGVEL